MRVQLFLEQNIMVSHVRHAVTAAKVQSFIFAYASRVVHNIHAYDTSITTEGSAMSLQHFHPSPFCHPITSPVLSLFSHPKKNPGNWPPDLCEVIYNENRPEKAAFVMSWQHYNTTTQQTRPLNLTIDVSTASTTFCLLKLEMISQKLDTCQ